jgi:hypothetical protein
VTTTSTDDGNDETHTESTLKVRVLIPSSHYGPNQIRATSKQLLQAASACLNALENYFQRAFPFDWLDIVCVPQLPFVGMENQSLCFRHLLVSPKDDPSSVPSVESDLLHELCHHWLGNYVGLSIRSKEGLVQYLERMMAPKLFPKPSSKASLAKPQSLQKKSPGVVSLSKSAAPSTIAQNLWRNFAAFFNHDFYASSLKEFEEVAIRCGEQKFRLTLSALLQENQAGTFVDDKTLLEKFQ